MNLTKTAHNRLVATLERLGWSLLTAEVNLVASSARVVLRRNNGLVVTLAANNGRTSITRERVRAVVETRGRRGDRYMAKVLRTELVGRTRHPDGIRSAMRSLCNYIEDNATTDVPRFTARRAFAALLQ